MITGRRYVIIGAVAGCVFGGCLTAWVMWRATPASVALKAETRALPMDVFPLDASAEVQSATSADTSTEPVPSQLEEAAAEKPAPQSRRTAVAREQSLPRLPQEDPGRQQHRDAANHAGSRRNDRINTELRTRATGHLQRLDGIERGAGSPIGRVKNLFAFLEQGHCAAGACQAVQRLTEDYVHARAALLRRMLAAFLESDGAYDGAREHDELATLHATFQAALTGVAERIPMLAMLPALLETTLRVPDYLEALPDNTDR